MADQFHVPDNVDPGIRRMIDALTPEYLRPNTKIVDPNAQPGKIPAVEPMNFAPFLAVDLLGNAAGLGAKAVGAGLKGAIFAGPMAANAPHKAYDLTRAALLNAKRESGVGTVIPNINDNIVRALWGKHGISPGLEGGLRHEIQDFGLKIPHFEKSDGYIAPLGDLVEHPDLFKAYPQLKDIELNIAKEKGAFRGSHSPATNRMKVRADNYDQARSVTAHELQHVVQRIENTPPGADPTGIFQSHLPESVRLNPASDDTHNKLVQQAWDLYRRNAGEVEAVNVQSRMTGHQYMTPPWLTEETTRANQLVPNWWLKGYDPLGLKGQPGSVQSAFEQVPNLANQPGVNELTMYKLLLGK